MTLLLTENYSVIKSRRMKWTGYVARIKVKRSVNMFFVNTPEGRIPLGRPRRRWDGIKMDLQEVECGAWTGSSWIWIWTGSGIL